MEAQHQQQLAKLKADVTRWKEVAKVAEEAGAAREAEVCAMEEGGRGFILRGKRGNPIM